MILQRDTAVMWKGGGTKAIQQDAGWRFLVPLKYVCFCRGSQVLHCTECLRNHCTPDLYRAAECACLVCLVLAVFFWHTIGRFTHSMPCPCRTHTVPLPCRAAKVLECVFPIWFTQCGRVWFTLAMPCPCHAPTMPFFSKPQQSTAVERWPFCAVALIRTAWSEHGMGMAWQVWIRHGRTV